MNYKDNYKRDKKIDEVRIKCEEITIKGSQREDALAYDETPPGDYLYISYEYSSLYNSEKNNKKGKYIPLQYFYEKQSEVRKMGTLERDKVVSISTDILQEENINRKVDYSPLLNFILKEVGIDTSIFEEDQEVKIHIQSSFQPLIELPWENIKDKANIYVIREIPKDSHYVARSVINNSNNLLIITSYSRMYNNELKLKQLDEGIKDETKGIMDPCIDRNEASFRFNNITLYKNITREDMKKIKIKDFSYIHFAMHVTNNGNLCMSKDNKMSYRYIDELSVDRFVSLLTRKLRRRKLKLVFFSTCNSTGNSYLNNEVNLAFDIIRRGISSYVIGYYNKGGNKSLSKISKIFYREIIANSGDVEKSYVSTLKMILLEGKDRKYIPQLYKTI